MNDAWRTWLTSGRLTGEGRHLGTSGDGASSPPLVEFATFGATGIEFDQEGVVMDILDHVFDRTHGGGCQCMHLRACAYLMPEAEDQIAALLAFRHSSGGCPAISQDEWAAVEEVARLSYSGQMPASRQQNPP